MTSSDTEVLTHFNSREFAKTAIDQDCRGVTGVHDNELFFNCVFEKLNGLTLKQCDLNQSQFVTENLRDALGFTVTLDCHSFDNVELSPLLFDLLLVLLVKTKGNTDKRRALMGVVGRDRLVSLLKQMKQLE